MNDSEKAEFSADEMHGFEKLQSIEVHRTSAGLGWPTAYFSVQSINPYSASFEGASSVFIGIIIEGSLCADINIRGVIKHLQGPPGSISIIADNAQFNCNLHSRINTAHLYIKRSIIDEIILNVYDTEPSDVEIYTQLCVFDSLIESILKEIGNSFFQRERSTFAYIDYLVRAVAAHTLKYYSSLSYRKNTSTSNVGLTSRLIERTRDLVETQLAERLTIADIAAGTGLSADHFGRLFKQSMGMTLHQFVMRRRVDRASYLLGETTKPIIQIAHECGFADQVHLTRVFRRIVGTTPAAFRGERKK